MRSVCLFMLFASSILAQTAQAWGPATHAYLVLHMPADTPPPLDTVFGAMHADCSSSVLKNPQVKSKFKSLTHHKFEAIARPELERGFALHNAADPFAHQYKKKEKQNDFPATKIRQLSATLGISEEMAEDLFELILDLSLAEECGPELGQAIYQSAQHSGIENEEALVKAFVEPLAASVPELTLAQAEHYVRWASRIHKNFLRAYGLILAQGEAKYGWFAPYYLAHYAGCNRKTAARYLKKAVEVCQGCRPELDRIAQEIAGMSNASAAGKH